MDLSILFKTVVSLSFMGSIVAGLIILIKQLFKNKLSGKWHYYIWVLLIIRLTIPYAPQSDFSIFNLFDNASKSIQLLQNKMINKDTVINLQNHNNSNLVNKVTNNKFDSIEEINRNTEKNVTVGKEINKETHKNNTTEIKQSNSKSFISNYLTIIWIAGIFIMLLYVIVVNMRLHRITSKWRQCKDDNISQLLEQCKIEMNINTNIPIILNNYKKAPYLLGFLRPKIIISSEIINGFSTKEIRYIFLHELAHLKKKDIMVNWTIILVQAVHWFNPIVWYAFYRMKQDCELACDETVLNYISAKEHTRYGQTIINLTKVFSNSYLTPGTTGIVNKSEIKRRIIMISKFGKKSIKWTFAAIAVTLAVGGIGLTNANNSVRGYLGLNSQKESKENETSKKEVTGGIEVLTLDKQKAILDNLSNSINKNAKVEEINQFVKDNISKVSKGNASIMISKLEEIQKKDLPKFEEKFSNGDYIQNQMNKVYKPDFDVNKIDYIQDKELKDLLVEVRNSGYKVETAEGMYFPVLNYEIYKQYSSYVTEDIKDYIEIMATESNKTPIKDAGLMISWDEILKRALKQEEFINKYGDSIKINNIKMLYKQYTVFALYGANNTPLFDYDTKVLVPEAKTSYTSQVKTNNSSKLLKNIKGLIYILGNNNYKFTDEIESYRKNIVEQLQ